MPRSQRRDLLVRQPHAGCGGGRVEFVGPGLGVDVPGEIALGIGASAGQRAHVSAAGNGQGSAQRLGYGLALAWSCASVTVPPSSPAHGAGPGDTRLLTTKNIHDVYRSVKVRPTEST